MPGQAAVATRACRTCDVEQPLSEFYVRSDGKPNLHCKSCVRAEVRASGARKRRDAGVTERWRPVERDGPDGAERQCSQCREFKAVEGFYRQPGATGGRMAICKDCAIDGSRRRFDAKLNGRPKRKVARHQRVVVIDDVEHRRCTRCGITKSLDRFYRPKSGPMSRCIDCVREIQCTADRSWRYTDEHRDRMRAYQRAKRVADPERFRGYAATRRARKRLAAVVDLTPEQWVAILAAYHYRCAYCGQPGRAQEHMVPLQRGGDHTASNIVPACKPCNSRKRTRTPDEWVARGGFPVDLGPHPFP